MHLGQASEYLSSVLGRPEPTMKMTGRVLRENGFVEKGGRGRNAPHLSDLELARFLITAMVSESPAIGVDRLPHFSSLQLLESYIDEEHKDQASAGYTAFDQTFAKLLGAIRGRTFEEGIKKNWTVQIHIAHSTAEIKTETLIDSDEPTEQHIFVSSSQIASAGQSQSSFPYNSGLEITATLPFTTLFAIAQAFDREQPAVKRQSPVPDVPA